MRSKLRPHGWAENAKDGAMVLALSPNTSTLAIHAHVFFKWYLCSTFHELLNSQVRLMKASSLHGIDKPIAMKFLILYISTSSDNFISSSTISFIKAYLIQVPKRIELPSLIFKFCIKAMGIRLPLVSHVKQIIRRSLFAPAVATNVPKGHCAVYIGEIQKKRFVVPIFYLNHPLFQNLLSQAAEEEFGFNHPAGGYNNSLQRRNLSQFDLQFE
ncbi:hypothetical protein GIB67_024783 [Kingdonia uniflora]|uniref:Uncharacterized protein n=1 Tax=Kingdonia uniflora TaxID=39325 RepID=A0A7J7NAP7_9MAGN|nr:hypothetical protein GIB67_024783 [Kingdonia uniflora]